MKLLTNVTFFAVVLTSGCSSLSVTQIANDTGSSGLDTTHETSGVRFYRPALHIWLTAAAPSDKVNIRNVVDKSVPDEETTTVTPIGPSACNARFAWLPDYSKEYIIQWKPGIGSVSPNFTLADGWNLTAVASTVDSKAAENATAVGSLLTAGISALTVNGCKTPGLYRVNIGSDGSLSLGTRVLSL
ncbi:MAG: hypothetical protein AAF662_03430 [Pseudomonadota bacterium]